MVDNRHFRRLGAIMALFSIALVATIFAMISGCDVLPGKITGDFSENQKPVVEFANVPADGDTFSYSPVIHWKGRDPDGFVEYYLYADIIDSTALADPDYYIPFIPEEAWKRTQTSSDTIYLLTSPGKITQHIFYLKCVDDRDNESDVIYRRFFRSNNPPNVPVIKWFTDPDENFGNDIRLTDTLYVLDRINDIWSGLGFVWKSNDPDDRDLYRIPLEYRYYLEKVPHDTVWQWVARDWTMKQDLNYAGLETGHYRFTVWARDDGYELSTRPASVSFDVYRPTFEQSILVINATLENPPAPGDRPGRGNVIPGTQIGDLYNSLVGQYPDASYMHYPNPDSIKPFKALLGRYRLVILCSESFSGVTAPSEALLRDYVRIGGKLWVSGFFLRKNLITNTTLTLAGGSAFAGPLAGVSVPANEAEFTGAQSGVRDLPSVVIDTAKSAETFRQFFTGRYRTYPLLPGVDVMTAGNNVETVYYFKSYTDTASGDIFDEPAEVKALIDTIYYPPTPLDCIIKLEKNRVLEVTRVENITRNVIGEVQTLTNNVGRDRVTVIRVSYPYGEPWAITDSIRVDYRYQPYSEFHLKPCGIRYERLSANTDGSFEIRYRIAVFTFPLYFLDNSTGEVTRMFNSMINWFFLPYAH